MATPGWYPDPTGEQQRQCYWDGTRWTRQIHWDGARWMDDQAPSEQDARQQVAPAADANPQIPTAAEPLGGQNWPGLAPTVGQSTVAARSNNVGIVLIGSGILFVLVVILVVVLISKPWESDQYKACVAQEKQTSDYPIDSRVQSLIENDCHAKYG
jgi:hypothetical protein